ncbi:MAG: polysaccharide deacetylase family protein [Lachnospiraceae bacterium]|nr:polysaccharide deacetylase family protein [Lachnospiraceae bacterium]
MIKALLTIDDIASKNTPALVDFLVSHSIPALMFAVGVNAQRYHDEAVYALKKGMVVGNHSYSHPHFSELDPEEGRLEIEKCEEVLDSLYRDAQVERKYRPFRFPYGDKGGDNKDALQKLLSDMGFDKVKDDEICYPWWKEMGLDRDIDTFWTYDFEEYRVRPDSGFTFEDVMRKMDSKKPESGAELFGENACHILLLHAHDETESMVPRYYEKMLSVLIERGVRFIKPEFRP